MELLQQLRLQLQELESVDNLVAFALGDQGKAEYDPMHPNQLQEIFQKRQQLAEQLRKEENKTKNQKLQGESPDQKIAKMMKNMGWKGKGLGAEEDGIICPLIAERVAGQRAQVSAPKYAKDENKTKLLFEDLVNIDEVSSQDRDDLEALCLEFGKVIECRLDFQGDEVRAIVEFESSSQSQECLSSLQGFEFRGRKLRISFE